MIFIQQNDLSSRSVGKAFPPSLVQLQRSQGRRILGKGQELLQAHWWASQVGRSAPALEKYRRFKWEEAPPPPRCHRWRCRRWRSRSRWCEGWRDGRPGSNADMCKVLCNLSMMGAWRVNGWLLVIIYAGMYNVLCNFSHSCEKFNLFDTWLIVLPREKCWYIQCNFATCYCLNLLLSGIRYPVVVLLVPDPWKSIHLNKIKNDRPGDDCTLRSM